MEKGSRKNIERERLEARVMVPRLLPGINMTDFEKKIRSEGNTGSKGAIFGMGFDETFSYDLLRSGYYEKILDLIQRCDYHGPIQGQTVVDIGCGNNSFGAKIAQNCGFDAYVGVEKNLESSMNKTNWGLTMPAVYVNEDMLTFLRRLPSESVSVMANGIDNFIITGEYRENVVEEIERVLSPKGLFLTDGELKVPNLGAIMRYGFYTKNNERGYE
jgi:ubiquinone/menaquinone biosynthesis C-methylase UbiE